MLTRFRRTLTVSACVALTVIAIAGCGSSASDGSSRGQDSSTGSGAGTSVVTFTPEPNATAVNPLSPVSVSVDNGTINSVTMTNDQGRTIAGIVTPDKTSWKPGEPLGYGKTYNLVVELVDSNGVASTQTSTFSTVEPGNQTALYLTATGGAPLDGGAFGVGLVVVAHFDEEIGDKAAAEQALSVSTEPAVQGSWYWVDGQNAHWRPAEYYTPGTTVSVSAKVYGLKLGDDLYGQEDTEARFTIGDSHISIADDTTKQVTVYENGELVRTMPTSMGMGGTEQVGNQTISFWTQPGIYTVMDKANPVVMDSSTFGLPVNSRLGYKESINYATRISTDGIYLHQLDSSVWAQGNTNTSHGCLNLNASNAQWFFDFAVPGDVVEVKNTGGAPLEVWQNGDWGVPWDEWQAGGALR